MTLNAGLLSSARPDWRTPSDLYHHWVPPLYDVSDTHDGTFDGLKDPWPDGWYCNPPYGRTIGTWTGRMNGVGLALVPARVDTVWAQTLLRRASWVLFIRGRLHFDDAPTGAPFPSMLVGFGRIDLPLPDGVRLDLPIRRL